jgi:hypothetical protein
MIDIVLCSFSHRTMAAHDDDLPYRVEVWDDKDSHIEEIIALTADYATAKSVYDGAVMRRPGRFITLRQKARILQSTRKN